MLAVILNAAKTTPQGESRCHACRHPERSEDYPVRRASLDVILSRAKTTPPGESRSHACMDMTEPQGGGAKPHPVNVPAKK